MYENTRQNKVPDKELKWLQDKMTKKIYRTRKSTRKMPKNMD
jgi:hypothetical protein